jgi:hypothetical protein
MSAYYSIESMLAIGVISTQWRSLEAGVHLVCAETGSPVDDSQLWEFVPDPAGSGYYFIKNQATGFVIDIEGESTATGALLVVNPQNETGTDSQLWQFFLDPSGSGYWMIMNKLTANVIDIQGDSPNDGVVLDSFPHTFPASRNELWSVIDGSFPGVVKAVPSPATKQGLTGNSNYIFNQQCNPFVNPSPTDAGCLNVIIDVTEDIVWASGAGKTQGFSFQLNCYSPKSSVCAWQQYVLGLRGNNIMYNVEGFAVDPENPQQSLYNVGIDNIASLPSSMIPAGYQLTIQLLCDNSNGNITQANFIVLDNEKNVVVNMGQPVTGVYGASEADLAPIVAFELNLVGPEDSETVYLSQGAGIITYSVPYRMTAGNARPVGANGLCTSGFDFRTGEQANSVYASLPANRNNIFKQRFGVQVS